MSDNEEGGKKSGYRLEYASSARAKCKGPKPCAGTPIAKGELRFGSLVDFKGNTTFAWRHWGCVTPKIFQNVKRSFEDAEDLDGFDELNDEDKEKVRAAWEVDHVADEDIPETARKQDDEDEEKPKKKAAPKKEKKEKESDEPDVFKFEYATSARAKCKACGESIGKDFFRIGHEVNFRGNKSFQYMHWGCLPAEMLAKLKAAYPESSDVEGFAVLKEAEQDKVHRAWDADEIPEEDKGPGEAVADVNPKKAPVKRAKKENGEPPKKRARKAKKDEDADELEEEEEEEEKPKKRAPPKKAAEKKAKAPPKKRAAKKKDDSESGEDFGDDLAAVDEDEDEDEADDSEESGKKRKRAAPSKAKASTSKPASKKAAKPSSSRKRQPVDEESDYE